MLLNPQDQELELAEAQLIEAQKKVEKLRTERSILAEIMFNSPFFRQAPNSVSYGRPFWTGQSGGVEIKVFPCVYELRDGVPIIEIGFTGLSLEQAKACIAGLNNHLLLTGMKPNDPALAE